MRINHIGYAVQDIKEAAKKFMMLGYTASDGIIEDVARQVHIQFFEDPSGMKIELVAPSHSGCPVGAWLAKNGNSTYHLCYECQNLEETIERLSNVGFLTVHAPAAAPALAGKRVAFLYSLQTGLLELVEIV